jgi:peptidoglycan/xylan/chitin deacetylase (PgdA/CDA1 family)
MLLKRSLVLVTGLLLFIIGFIVYFDVVDADIEKGFQQERQKFGVDGAVLTAPVPTPSTPAPSAQATPSAPSDTASTSPPSTPPTPAPVDTTPSPTPAPVSAPLTPATSDSSALPPDTNVIIGPVPPPSAPATPDTNSAPMTPPTSTMLLPKMRHLALLLLAGYQPANGGIQIQTPTPVQVPANLSPMAPDGPIVITPPASSATNGSIPLTNNPAATGTNGAPFALSTGDSGAPRPVPVEASVIVLLYHQFTAPGVSSKNPWSMKQDVFAQEMNYLKDNGYHVVPMSDLLKFIKHEIGLPPNSVVITIDDGYKSAIVYAAPILKQNGFPWTYFIYPDFITVNEGKGAASWNDLLALQADGVDIESHSMTHPMLTKHHQKDKKGVWHNFSPEEYEQWLTNETAGSKALLEQKMGKPIICFAYPYGDYNKEVEAKAIAAGYQAIFTVADNPVHSTTNPFSIGRYTMTQPVERAFASFLHQGALSLANADPAPGSTTSQPRPVITAVLGYTGNLDPKSIETDVRDFGAVRHDYDPVTSTIRLYLPRDLIQPTNIVNIRVKDAETGQVMVANWHFNYEPASAAATHAPISSTPPTTTTNSPSTISEPSIPPTPTAMPTNTVSASPTIKPAPVK